jgi:RNA polymerase sigma-70 factor (ECF subfamily)
MDDTSLSLLDRLQHHDDPETWDRLVSLYAPLLRGWLRKYDVQESDVDDLVQEVLLAVAKDLKSFEHAGDPGAFRSWLRTILVNRLRHFWRARGRRPQTGGDSDLERRINQLEDPAGRMSQLWNREHDRYVMRQLLTLAEPHFEPQTWQAFCRVALEGERPDAVAEELGMTLNSVFIAKSRVLSRLRREVEGLVESSSDFLAKP